jgi:hypothetical protein
MSDRGHGAVTRSVRSDERRLGARRTRRASIGRAIDGVDCIAQAAARRDAQSVDPVPNAFSQYWDTKQSAGEVDRSGEHGLAASSA